MPFKFLKMKIPDVVLITPRVFEDGRGHFYESYKKSEFLANGITDDFVQDNCSQSVKGVLRGFHYQIAPYAQSKLVQCQNGTIFDVAADIRKNSPTFGQWVGCELSEENKHILYIPAGFAHAFYTVSEQARVAYKVSAEYNSAAERGIIWNDKTLNVQWPDKDVILSDKDTLFPALEQIGLD